ncbi:MAG: hypothetical protein WCK05_10915, partial [Planctomycetota bacterium]
MNREHRRLIKIPECPIQLLPDFVPSERIPGPGRCEYLGEIEVDLVGSGSIRVQERQPLAQPA